MPISPISLSNTFSQWLYSTQSIINEVNKIESGIYTKTSNTFYITSPGLALSVSNSVSFGLTTSNTLYVTSNSTLAGISASHISSNTVISGIISVSGNNIYVSTNSPRVNSNIVINRGESANSANADAILQWNESTKNWRVRNVNNPTTYNNLIDSSNYASSLSPGIVLLRDNISNNSSTVAASANSLNFVYNLVLSANASYLTTGTVNPARLGSGTANATTYLRGDNTWGSAGSILSNDVSSSTPLYIGLSSSNTGAWTSAIVSTSKLHFTPSTGTLFSSNVKTSGLYDSSNRQLLIKDSNGVVVWGN